MHTRGLLLVNLGTPEAPTPSAVGRYLREFLGDPRVIDVPPLLRWFLVNVMIVPRRKKASAALYQRIWTTEGSPLLIHGRALCDRVTAAMGPDVMVQLAMRYGNPSIAAALHALHEAGVSDITVLPLFPQYATSSWGSAVAKVYDEAARLWNTPSLHVIPPFYHHPAYHQALERVSRPVLEQCAPDFLVISFHGIPMRHVEKSGAAMAYAYRSQCLATAQRFTERLGWPADRYAITFQSRLGRDPWLEPFTDHVLMDLPKRGIRRVAVACLSFVADCLETLEEIAGTGQEQFRHAGGEALYLIPSLNSDPAWVEAIGQLVKA